MSKQRVVEYHPNGLIKSEVYYADGRAEGVAKWYRENGIVSWEACFFLGKKLWVRGYYPSGRLSVIEEYKGGRISFGRHFYENGNIRSTKNYRNDKLEGVVCQYRENGELECSQIYKNGFLVSEKRFDCTEERRGA